MKIVFEAETGGRSLSIETGKIAKQADGSVVVQYGETIVLVTVVSSPEVREGVNFLPLTVEYQEKIYAAGRIPGNYFRREIGRPSEKETLTARLIDRPIRPLFPENYNHETQVVAMVLSMDYENEPDMLAMLGASAALEISDVPFDGPVACCRVGRIDGKLKVNPLIQEYEQSDLNIFVAGTRDGIVMVEGGGDTVSEKDVTDAIYFAHESMQPLIDLQVKLKEAVGRPKRTVEEKTVDNELRQKIEENIASRIRRAVTIAIKQERQDALRQIKEDLKLDTASWGIDYEERKDEIDQIFSDIKKEIIRNMILGEGIRIDGRKFDEIRPIHSEVGILPRPHGSALFTRGETQALGVLTIGSGQDEQRIETLSGDEFRPFMLHYNFPPFSVGEVKRIMGPSRRDIGHGALSTRAVEKVLPPREKFDYVIRVVSEVLESNGSSSMATVCAASLALMDGGVPISSPVSGIAMGLIKDDDSDNVAILSDIIGDEDHYGDMDFKVAGSREGITALQMDIKIRSLSRDILEKALEQARQGRIHILDKMLITITEPREEISQYAPKTATIKINPDKIRDVIGPGGKIIRSIQSETNTRIEIDDSGEVKVAAQSKEDLDNALDRIREITVEPEVGKIYEGPVVKITDFGAFVQILPGTDGLVHISQLSPKRVKKVSDVVKEGEMLKVKLLEISKDGKLRLSHKAVLEEENTKNG